MQLLNVLLCTLKKNSRSFLNANVRTDSPNQQMCLNAPAHFQISMLEIYNESLNDLLTKNASTALDIRVQGKSVSVPGLTQIRVQTEADIVNVMETGEKNRKIASTKMNTQRYFSIVNM